MVTTDQCSSLFPDLYKNDQRFPSGFDTVNTSSCSLAALSKSDWSLNTDSESDTHTVFSWPSRYCLLGMPSL